MFGFSHLPELIVVLVIALIVFGPKRLPELGSSLGKGIREFRKATTELQDGFKSDSAASLSNEAHNYATPATTPATNAEYVAAAPHTEKESVVK